MPIHGILCFLLWELGYATTAIVALIKKTGAEPIAAWRYTFLSFTVVGAILLLIPAFAIMIIPSLVVIGAATGESVGHRGLLLTAIVGGAFTLIAIVVYLFYNEKDVVAAEGEWLHPGFSGEIVGNQMWGRGTVDTKTPLFGEFSALEELLEEGYEPPCNVYIASSHSEELGGDGIPKALAYFKGHKLSFEVILDEWGAII